MISRACAPPDRLAHRAELLVRPLQPQPVVVGLQVGRAHGLQREARIAARRLSEAMGLAGLRVQQVHDALQIIGLPAIGGVHVCKPGLHCDEAVLQRRELGLRRDALLPFRRGQLLLLHGIGSHLGHRLRELLHGIHEVRILLVRWPGTTARRG